MSSLYHTSWQMLDSNQQGLFWEREVTQIYRIILFFWCSLRNVGHDSNNDHGSIQRPKSDLNRRPPAWQAGALTRLSYWAIIIFWLLPLLDIVAVGAQSLISLRVVRVYHMLIESPTREFLATKGLSFFCAVVINVIKLERPVVRESTFCTRHTVVLKDLASPFHSIFSCMLTKLFAVFLAITPTTFCIIYHVSIIHYSHG